MTAHLETGHRLDGATPKGRKSGLVLLVEDDPETLRVTAYFLRQLGFRSLEAAGAVEAVELARANRESIDLLVTDVAMPVMNGIELVQRVRRELPNLPVIFLVGLVAAPASELPATRFLRKPFSKNQLATTLRATLEAATPSCSAPAVEIASISD